MSEAAIQRSTRVFPGSQSALWLVLFYRSTIGKKVIMALTGMSYINTHWIKSWACIHLPGSLFANPPRRS